MSLNEVVFMDKKLKEIIHASVFNKLVLEGKKGIFIDELYDIGDKVWKEAQKDIIEKLLEFEKNEGILIITTEDREMLHGYDFTQDAHIRARQHFKHFLRKHLEA